MSAMNTVQTVRRVWRGRVLAASTTAKPMLRPVRHFTPDEANAELEHVRPLVEELVAQRAEHVAALKRQEELEGGLATLVDEIAGHGAEVKDIDSGLIDFPALRNGETVLLCWQLGEDEIAFWHRTDDGFAGRRPLPLDQED